MGPKLSDKFKERLTATDASVQRALELSTITLGKLRLWLNIDKVSQAFELRAVNTLTQDVILGVDFCKEMDMDVQLGKGLWRV